MNVNDEVRKFILEQIITDQKQVNLEKSTNLIDEGIIDSLGIMKLLTFIEETFGIQISDDELVPENFETIEAICTMVAEKVNAA